MSSRGAIKHIRSIWGKAGVSAPQPEETKGTVERKRKQSARSPRYGGVQVSLRITREEKRRFELIALREDMPLSEIFSRMLALYEETHGRVELSSAQDK